MGLPYEVGDIVTLKKVHPCGSRDWEILRVGADFRLKCTGCGHQIMVPRKMVEKNTKNLIKKKNSTLQTRKTMLESTLVIYFISLLFDRQRANRP
mgnify:FL=1